LNCSEPSAQIASDERDFQKGMDLLHVLEEYGNDCGDPGSE